MLFDASTEEACHEISAEPAAVRTIPYTVVRSDLVGSMGWNNANNGQLFTFSGELSSNPLVLASLITRMGSDGGWLRQDLDKLSSSGAHLVLEENSYTDATLQQD